MTDLKEMINYLLINYNNINIRFNYLYQSYYYEDILALSILIMDSEDEELKKMYKELISKITPHYDMRKKIENINLPIHYIRGN